MPHRGCCEAAEPFLGPPQPPSSGHPCAPVPVPVTLPLASLLPPSLQPLQPEDGSQPEAYSGELKAPALHAFLSGLAGGGREGDSGKEGKKGGKEGGKESNDKAAAAAFVRRVQGLGAAGLAELEAREDMALLAVYGAEGGLWRFGFGGWGTETQIIFSPSFNHERVLVVRRPYAWLRRGC